ncbi:hypothetical protein EUTSA_v10015908mg [Eutrema salsugineum]|uniref:MADS-box domain-containing protein n=1 Tax=Eutrema salsugineum TaxID=72664 RepID=V4LIP1_EUTSA|nr:agamous-like MADS-box protein AGL62 [Eutrema salsugineum]ESQ42302.1 hypothetical protein EUTSA_v10015908mg [Eutrema salsugineum]
MVRKSKGRQKIEMVKMQNESNLQVTFSKRRSGLFKKASELCTLCDAEVAIIVHSPGQKVFSFGHPNVKTVIDRFVDNDPPTPQQHGSMQLNEIRRNSNIRDLNNQLTQLTNQLESEKKKNEDLKKIRKNSQVPERWWEKPIEELDLAQAKQFKSRLEELKREVTLEASKMFQTAGPQQNFYAGSSSHAPFGVNNGNNFNLNLDQLNQRRMVDMNAFYNQNMLVSNRPLPFGNNFHGNAAEISVPEYNMTRPGYNQNQNLNFRGENISENEGYHGGYPPESGSGY